MGWPLEKRYTARTFEAQHDGLVALTMGASSSKKVREVQVLLLGLDGSGKSSVLARLCGEETRTVMPTRGFELRTVSLDSTLLKLRDVGGRRDLRYYWDTYCRV